MQVVDRGCVWPGGRGYEQGRMVRISGAGCQEVRDVGKRGWFGSTGDGAGGEGMQPVERGCSRWRRDAAMR